MSYDVVMVGGSGAQFGLALYECLGLGFVELPNQLFVVDADKGFVAKLEEANKAFAEQVVEFKNHVAGDAKQVKLPALRPWAPYGDRAKPKFTVLDLIDANPLSRLGQICLTEDEATYSIHEGLFGMAKLGGVIVADRAAQARVAAAGVEARGGVSGFPEALVRALGDNQPNSPLPIVIAGSVAGGTGAGFIAPLVRAIRMSASCAQRPVHVFAFLPWFELPSASDDIGPSNKRMAQNASQGIRFLQDVIAEVQAGGNRQQVTCVHVIGLPDGAQKPVRNNQESMHKQGPGPMMYYAASLLSKDMAAFTGTAAQVQSGVFALTCNPTAGEIDVLRGRVKYSIPGLGVAAGEIPFDAVKDVLDVVHRALETVKNPVRYENAFGMLLDNSDSLPKTIYRALKSGRESTAKRKAAGAELARLLGEQQQRLASQAKKLADVNATVTSSKVDVPLIPDWAHDKLADVLHIQELLERSPKLLELLTNAIAQNKIAVAADLIVRSLVHGLGIGRGNSVSKVLADAYKKSADDIMALPGTTPTSVDVVQGTSLVKLTPDVVDKLGVTLAGNVPPDSQCIPSALARARIARFMIEPGRLRDDYTFPMSYELAEKPEGRLLLCWLGVSAGLWSIAERQFLEGSAVQRAGNFDKAVSAFEPTEKNSPTPYRSAWVSFLASKPGGGPALDAEIVAASSPQTGWFTSVRVDEGRKKSNEAFRKLAEEISNRSLWGPLQATYRVWLEQVSQTHPSVERQPWFNMLSLFAGRRAPTDEERRGSDQYVWCTLGPLPMQVDGRAGDSRPATVVDLYLPRLLEPKEREAMVCVLGGAATQAFEAYPALQLELKNGHIEFQLATPLGTTTMLKVRGLQQTGGLDFESELRGGAYEIVDWSGALGLPGWEQGFRPQFAPRVRAHFGAGLEGQRLELLHIVDMMRRRPEYARALGLDDVKLNTLRSMAGNLPPFRPGILNLFNSSFKI